MQSQFVIRYFQVTHNGTLMIYRNSDENYAAIATIYKDGNIKAVWSSVQKYTKEHKKRE